MCKFVACLAILALVTFATAGGGIIPHDDPTSLDVVAGHNGATQFLSVHIDFYGVPESEYTAKLYVQADPTDPDSPPAGDSVSSDTRTTSAASPPGVYGSCTFILSANTDNNLPPAAVGWKWQIVFFGPNIGEDGLESDVYYTPVQ